MSNANKSQSAVQPVTESAKPVESHVIKLTRLDALRKTAGRHAKGTLPFRVATERGYAKGSIQGVPKDLTVEGVRKLAETAKATITLPKGEVINVDGIETQCDEKYSLPAGALLPFLADLREELKAITGQ